MDLLTGISLKKAKGEKRKHMENKGMDFKLNKNRHDGIGIQRHTNNKAAQRFNEMIFLIVKARK